MIEFRCVSFEPLLFLSCYRMRKMGGNASPGKVNFTAGLSLFLKEKQQQRFVPLQDLQQSCCTNGKDQDNQNVINLQNEFQSLEM